MGIRKKIILGFILIGILLIMSGVLSSIELAKLNSNTASEIKVNEEILKYTKSLLDAVQVKNTAVLSSIKDTTGIYDSIIVSSEAEFDRILILVKSKNRGLGYLQRIEAANDRYNTILQSSDTISMDWFADIYWKSYSMVITTIKDYMIFQQDEFQKYTEVLEDNVYRALMVGIISLAAGILLLAAFYFMIHTFFLSPVLKMEKALHDFLRANITYSVRIETKDEINSLSDNIEELCSRIRKKEL